MPSRLSFACLTMLLGACAPALSLSGDRSALIAPQDPIRLEIRSAARSIMIHVELAASRKQQAKGLQDRDLPEDSGMLFVYAEAQPPDAAFWMSGVRIPLDIAFLDAHGEILAIRRMEPCTSAHPRRCPRYTPGVAYWSALEVNAGFFDDHGIGVGDRVRLFDGRAPGALIGGH